MDNTEHHNHHDHHQQQTLRMRQEEKKRKQGNEQTNKQTRSSWISTIRYDYSVTERGDQCSQHN